MRLFFTFILSLFSLTASFAQIGLEHIYNYSEGSSAPMEVANLESAGKKYVIHEDAWTVKIYNLDHSIYKTINIPTVNLVDTNAYNEYYNRVFYVKEGLFDTDAEIEFMFMIEAYNSNTNSDTTLTAVVNETGSLLFKQGGVRPVYKATDVLASVFNTASDGTKMVLMESSYPSKASYVYSLPGSLSCDPCGSVTGFRSTSAPKTGLKIKNQPNPAQTFTNIYYELPLDVKDATLLLYNLNGVLIHSYKIDHQFDHLQVSTTDLPSGTYIYSIQTDKGEIQSKKMVVAK